MVLVSVDGTDFRIQEPMPFDRKWFSHKFNGPGVRYEVGISIASGDIVWTNGPFPCGEWNDLKIAKSKLHNNLLEGELYVADSGYRSAEHRAIIPSGLHNSLERKTSKIRARHESYNRRFKQWKVLGGLFRHKLQKHKFVFNAVANITQMMLDQGEMMSADVEQITWHDLGTSDVDEIGNEVD